MRIFENQATARAASLRLLALFALAVAATVLGVHAALALSWWAMNLLLPFDLSFPHRFFAVNVGVTLLLVLGGCWIETSNLRTKGGAERLARRLGARELRPSHAPAEQRLANIVDEICIAAHMPRPQLMVLARAEAINAFAAGWEPADSVVAVTQGALDCLTRDELQGLVAHECSHVHEGDTRMNMQLAGMVFGLELVWGFGEDVRGRGGLAWLFGSAIMLMGSFGSYAGRWLQAAVSREREFLADARAVQWTRSRDGLGGVLRKALTQREQGMHELTTPGGWLPAARHLLLVGDAGSAAGRFDSHPPLELRIERIYGRPMRALELPQASKTFAVF